MPGSIEFTRLVTTSQSIEVLAKFDGQEHKLWYEFDRSVRPSTNAIATALSTLCGTKFDAIYYDFPVADQVVERLENFTKSSVKASESTSPIAPRGGGHILSFSGGFDSYAALRLLGPETHLVSLDFGGWFEREARFFTDFNPLVIKTNIRRTPTQKDSLARNHWTFMATGAILTAEYFGATQHSFGSILGETFSRPVKAPKKVAPLEIMGLQESPVTNGITELGTAKLLLQSDPDHLADSIDSLAGNTDRKKFLKTAITTLLAPQFCENIRLPQLPNTWSKPIDVTDSYTTTMSLLYFISQGHKELIAPLFKEIPDSLNTFASKTDMSFMLKANTDYYQFLPHRVAGKLLANLERYGFSPYTEFDWENAKAAREFLNQLFGK
ncbi:hypothetical protein [Corynebacterium sp. ACRPO]|uniref:hypothetical protein n=1 Tax=Corynebacterium sp. ACRPO TaxID=2918200 RepID=UPI001EF5DED1|nr:hypothetical protein [Corynebacterium sp. ACRPO]MCG7445770.1 hypothetical protein [Corynebacterium sp. ACRPO]